MVWIESTISKAGRGPAPPPPARPGCRSRSAQATCRGRARSGPPELDLFGRLLTRDIETPIAPVRAMSVAAWSTRVDLPIPGSPPSRTRDPGTNPPPRTRFSSAISTGSRAIVLVCKSPSRTGVAPVVRLAARAPED